MLHARYVMFLYHPDGTSMKIALDQAFDDVINSAHSYMLSPFYKVVRIEIKENINQELVLIKAWHKQCWKWKELPVLGFKTMADVLKVEKECLLSRIEFQFACWDLLCNGVPVEEVLPFIPAGWHANHFKEMIMQTPDNAVWISTHSLTEVIPEEKQQYYREITAKCKQWYQKYKI